MSKPTRKDVILERLRNDEDYYGEFGQQFLSNSNIQTLLSNPLMLRQPTPPNINFLLGGYFHTSILEPEKICNFPIVDASTRTTNLYKDAVKEHGKMILLKSEADHLNSMVDKVMKNEICRNLIKPNSVNYEIPEITEINGVMWKGKADILNHTEQLIVDLKTTSNINDFKYSAYKYNYDSQAYIYKQLFGYDLVFLAVDKITGQIGVFNCSEEFLLSGEQKVLKAVETYNMFFIDEDFNPENHYINLTL